MENKVEKIARIDRDKKAVIVKISEEGDIHKSKDLILGKGRTVSEQEYPFENIKIVWADLNNNLNSAENVIKQLKERIAKATELTPERINEIEWLKDLIQDTQMVEQANKDKEQLEYAENNLKMLKKDKLVLEPIIKKLPKK